MQPCLFSREEDDVREIRRGSSSDEPVLKAIRLSLAKKPRDHGGFAESPVRSMSQIGC